MQTRKFGNMHQRMNLRPDTSCISTSSSSLSSLSSSTSLLLGARQQGQQRDRYSFVNFSKAKHSSSDKRSCIDMERRINQGHCPSTNNIPIQTASTNAQ